MRPSNHLSSQPAGVYSGAILKILRICGAKGVQLGTRFVATDECGCGYTLLKQSYLDAKEEDITIINSPVGMPGRALFNDFIAASRAGQKKPFKCIFHCLHTLPAIQKKRPIASLQAPDQRHAWPTSREGFAFAAQMFTRLTRSCPCGGIDGNPGKEYDAACAKT